MSLVRSPLCVSHPALRGLARYPPQQPVTPDAVIGAEQAVDEGLRPRRRREGIWIGMQLAVDRGGSDPARVHRSCQHFACRRIL